METLRFFFILSEFNQDHRARRRPAGLDIAPNELPASIFYSAQTTVSILGLGLRQLH